jgi:tRNA A-37 threonylcarbamoyl transferase component Bud32
MFTHFPPPPAFTLIRKGNTSILIKEEYKNLLLEQGIENVKIFLEKARQSSNYLKGRARHPSIPIKAEKRMVVRQYLHGGLFRYFTRDFYLFGSRSFQELALTEEVRSCGIPTVEPIAAIHRSIFGPLYQAYLLSLEIPRANDLIQYFREIGPQPSGQKLILKRKVIRSAGLLLQRFHLLGFFHGDLQLKNILIAEDHVFVIDFDRSCRKETLSVRERMKNLLRLNRSVEKWRHLGLSITRTDRWRFFSAYAGKDDSIRNAMKKAMQTYSVRHYLYRLGWTFQRILRV